MHFVQPGEVQIAPIHDVKSPSLKRQDIEHVDIAHLAVADVNEAGDTATQVQQRMQLDSGLGGAKRSPTEQTQTQIDGARIQGVHIACDVDIQPQWLIGIELVGPANQDGSEVRPDVPIASFIGIGQGRSTHRLTQTHAIELGRIGAQSGLDITQRFTPSQLRVGHDSKVLSAGQSGDPRVSRVASHDPREAGPGYELHHLSKKCLSRIHNNFRELSS